MDQRLKLSQVYHLISGHNDCYQKQVDQLPRAESCQGLFSLKVEAQREGISYLVTLKTIAVGLDLMENSI